MKNKNPLYVVSEDNIVEEVAGYWQLVIKKLNLAPFLDAIAELLNYIWKQVDSYPMLVAVKGFVDRIMNLLGFIFPATSPATV